MKKSAFQRFWRRYGRTLLQVCAALPATSATRLAHEALLGVGQGRIIWPIALKFVGAAALLFILSRLGKMLARVRRRRPSRAGRMVSRSAQAPVDGVNTRASAMMINRAAAPATREQRRLTSQKKQGSTRRSHGRSSTRERSSR